jgi:hypothetical protein
LTSIRRSADSIVSGSVLLANGGATGKLAAVQRGTSLKGLQKPPFAKRIQLKPLKA